MSDCVQMCWNKTWHGPTNGIPIDFEIRSNFTVLWCNMCSTDHNDILYKSRQHYCSDVYKIYVWSVEYIMNNITNFIEFTIRSEYDCLPYFYVIMPYFQHNTSLLPFHINVVLTLSIGSLNDSVPNKRQAISRGNYDKVQWCIFASPGSMGVKLLM